MLGAIHLADLATLGLLEQATSGWIWSERGAQTKHTAERWPAPGTHAGSHLRTVQLAKAMDKVARSVHAIDLDVDLVPWAVAATCKLRGTRTSPQRIQGASHFWIRTCVPPSFLILLGTTVNSNSTAPEFRLGPQY